MRQPQRLRILKCSQHETVPRPGVSARPPLSFAVLGANITQTASNQLPIAGTTLITNLEQQCIHSKNSFRLTFMLFRFLSFALLSLYISCFFCFLFSRRVSSLACCSFLQSSGDQFIAWFIWKQNKSLHAQRWRKRMRVTPLIACHNRCS